jgi:uncharacterized Zn-binding protein involved in type VI secretion
MSFPAARAGADFAMLPMLRVMEGSENVFINNFPAARAGADFAMLPMLRIMEGSENVFIG